MTIQHTPADGEVVGIDADGCLLLWNGETESPYNCCETLEEFGPENLTVDEAALIAIAKTGSAA